MTDEEREETRKRAREELERFKQEVDALPEEKGDLLLELEIKWQQQQLDEMLAEKRRRETPGRKGA